MDSFLVPLHTFSLKLTRLMRTLCNTVKPRCYRHRFLVPTVSVIMGFDCTNRKQMIMTLNISTRFLLKGRIGKLYDNRPCCFNPSRSFLRVARSFTTSFSVIHCCKIISSCSSSSFQDFMTWSIDSSSVFSNWAIGTRLKIALSTPSRLLTYPHKSVKIKERLVTFN